MSNGVRQGSILSPYLFNVYINGISAKLNSLCIGCICNNTTVNHLFYADDMCIFGPSSKGLQELIDCCVSAGKELDIIFRTDKCKVMIFKCRMFSYLKTPNFCLDASVLKEVTSFKYLGHIISNDLKDDLDIQRQYKAIYARGNALIRTFSYCSSPVKNELFKSFLSSLYTCQLWRNFNLYTIRKLFVAYHGIFKKMHNLPSYSSNSFLFATNYVPTCQELMRKYVYSFKSKVMQSSNSLVASVRVNDQGSKLFTKWSSILY